MSFASDRLPPVVASEFRWLAPYIAKALDYEPDAEVAIAIESVFGRVEHEASRAPELAEFGMRLVRTRHPTLRRWGCSWLALFPSLEAVRAMRAIALDASAPIVVRDQAVCTLGSRRLANRHDALYWAPEVVRAADEALREAAVLDDKRELEQLPLACRHADSDALFALFAADPVRWAAAIEAFGDAPLARRLLAALPEIPALHAARIVRLIAHVLGAEAAQPLLAYAEQASGSEQIEALYAAHALDPSLAAPQLAAFLDGLQYAGPYRARAAWHAANPGVIPTVRALAIARRTATLPSEERTDACRRACDDLFALGRLYPHAESYLYALWRELALRARDPQRAADLISAHRPALEEPALVERYLEALASQGRFRQLAALAQERDAASCAAWLLATHGRPFLALATRQLAKGNDPRAVAAQVIALVLAGRPDLARETITADPPRSAVLRGVADNPPFPGPDERWRIAHEPELHPWLVGLTGELPALLAHARGAPSDDDADPDAFDLDLVAAFERRVRRALPGSCAYLVGEFADRAAIERALEANGVRLVAGPFDGTDYFVIGDRAPLETVARLERMGARRLELAQIGAAS